MDFFDKVLKKKQANKENLPPLTQHTPKETEKKDSFFSINKSNKQGNEMTNHSEYSKIVDDCFEKLDADKAIKDSIKKTLILNFNDHVSTSKLKERLQLLFEYEKNYLSLIKDFKEEIKFVGSLQEDLRKERAKFFSDTLQEVSSALKDSQVGSDVASQWIQELVNSYTKSLDVSSSLIEEHTFDTIGDIRRQAKNEINSISEKNQVNEQE